MIVNDTSTVTMSDEKFGVLLTVINYAPRVFNYAPREHL